jgi:hypothetical protein
MDAAVTTGVLSTESTPLLTLLHLESLARKVQESQAMPFLIVNETRALLNYRQAILFKAADNQRQTMRVAAISSIAVLDKDAQMLQWLEKTIADLYQADQNPQPRVFLAQHVKNSELSAAWQEYSLPYIAWAPFYLPSGNLQGGLWLSRETPWNEHELILLARLCDAYAHAWHALPGSKAKPLLNAPFIRAATVALLASLLIPVRLSALAPVEVTAEYPDIITSPLDGVIAEIYVNPNQQVHLGQDLLRFEDTLLSKDFEVAEKSLAIAKAEHMRAMQGAFGDEKNKAEMALLKAKVDLAAAERSYAQDVLNKVVIPAPSEGVAVFRDIADWRGKPVKTGEKIMEIANPKQLSLKLYLPIKEAIAFPEGAEVKAFFDADPLHPLTATVQDISYQAELVQGDLLAYRINAQLPDQALPAGIRIGWQGTAKIYGARVPVLYYLLRRPFSALRQYLGL